MSAAVDAAVDSLVLDLDDQAAVDANRTGTKAANLAAARRAGLPTLPGFVITVAGHRSFAAAGGVVPASLAEIVREPWRRLRGAEKSRALVVRSSSTIEDVGNSSMAGRFRSVLGVDSWEGFVDALAVVFHSAESVRPSAPMAVLVQPQLNAECGGVMFGVDPVTGDRGQIVIEAVAGGPDSLVSGRVTAQRYVLTRRGHVRSVDHRRQGRRAATALVGRNRLRALAALARRTAEVYGGPQDVEWAIDDEHRLWLLQSRPVTAWGDAATAAGPVLGPGPVAETFPALLRPLEVDMWVSPLRDGVIAALRDTHAVSRGRLRDSLVVTTVGGRVAVDLELFGYETGRRRGPVRLIDPLPGLRRLGAAWQVGRMRHGLADRAAALAGDVDVQLESVPPPWEMSDGELLDRLTANAEILAILHRDEVLAGSLVRVQPPTAASVALTALRAAHARDLDAAETLRRHPVVLALVPPQVKESVTLPEITGAPVFARDTNRPMGPREAIRLRARWVQELSARVALELGRRLAGRGVLPDAESVAYVHPDELAKLVGGEQVIVDLDERTRAYAAASARAPLPSLFRLSREGEVIPAARRGARPSGGVGAGGGRGMGPVTHGNTRPDPGDVLVVRDLNPDLAVLLPGLAGLVAETGSTLSHLAILAREYNIPTVVAVHDAVHRFPPGVRLLVDGTTGEVIRDGDS
ncbi:MAG TPA: PEP/pyruvate-binding domain-containing protein [Streptosporangiaceae bacterium]|nr:PEP/pyruvate-binding domain-containing protein [Streptosporangiaceae bacterium]